MCLSENDMTISNSKNMGKVTTTIIVTNRIDQILAERGLIPLEYLGLEPDLKNQKLRVLPVEGKDTYLMVL
jgi:hypothetical protein